MKKALIVILALLLILGGLFFWKGGHHAIVLSEIVEEWLDADSADQTLSLRISIPGARVDESGTVRPHIQQYALDAQTFWTEYQNRPLFGLTAEGVTAWTDGKNLYMDTGKAYALPELPQWRRELRKIAVAMLLRGRMTRHDDTYNLTMKTGELEVHVDIIADTRVQAVDLIAVLPDESAVIVSIVPKATQAHPVPQQVTDAIVRAKMEPPMALTEPLEVLIPAMEHLLPLEGDLILSVESGILKLSETVLLQIDPDKAQLTRRGEHVTLDLPVLPKDLDPLALSLMLLCRSDFDLSGDDVRVELVLPPETASKICSALVPQMESLGMTFEESQVILTVMDGSIQSVTMDATGSFPILLATLSLSFHAELNIH